VAKQSRPERTNFNSARGSTFAEIKGQPTRVLKAGEFVCLPRGTVHRNQNLSSMPARSIELNITDKDKPQTEQVTE
jgi:quercetin dioxygenase-like cupin family protein